MHRRDKKYLSALSFGAATIVGIFALLPTAPPWIEDQTNWRVISACVAGFLVFLGAMLLTDED
jgi:hypothetical protein